MANKKIYQLTANASLLDTQVIAISGPSSGDASKETIANISTLIREDIVAGDIPDLSGTYQPLDAGLTSISGLTTSANKMAYTTDSDTYATTDLTAFARTLLDDADAATARATLGVDVAGTDNSTDVTLAGTGTYISIAGQVITVDPITESDISDLGAYITGITGEPLSDLSDVTITTIASGELLKRNGTAWINNTLAEAGISATGHTHTASEITDFDTEVANNTDVAANTSARHSAVTVLDSSEIDFTLTGQQITASIITGSIDVLKLDAGVQTSLGLADSALQGNQTVTLSGDITGSGSTAITTTIASGAVDIAMLSATGTPSSSTYLRGDNTWATVSGSGVTFGLDNQIPYTNSTVDDYDYSANLTFDGTILGVTGNVDITGDLDVDSIKLDGSTVSVPAGSLTLTASGRIIVSKDLQLSLGTILGASARETLELTDVGATAVNQINISNSATGNAPILASAGDDTNISLNIVPKGTGVVQANGVEVSTISGTQTLTNKSINLTNNTLTGTKAQFDTSCSDGNFMYIGDAPTSHTHTASEITDFDTEVANNTDVAANTSARHSAVTVTDSAEIDFTLTGQQITASIVAGSIDETKLDASVNASLDLADSALQSSAIGVTVQGYDADTAKLDTAQTRTALQTFNQMAIDPTPTADETCNGPSTTVTAGATITAFTCVMLQADGKFDPADSSTASSAGANGMLGIALEASTDTNPLDIALPGSFVRDDTWNWTVGGIIYLGTSGALTHTAPTTTGHTVRVLGKAYSADIIHFTPSSDYIEL